MPTHNISNTNTSMPRTSFRQQVINQLDDLTLASLKQSHVLRVMGVDSSKADDLSLRLRRIRFHVDNSRYITRKKRYRRRSHKFDQFLSTDTDDCVDDREFVTHFRLRRFVFWKLVKLLEKHASFQRRTSDSRGKAPRPASCQLLVLLKYYGTEGNGASSINLGTFFGIATGAVDDYKRNALEALLSLEPRTCHWPDEEERKTISSRVMTDYMFPHCIGLIDGTLLPLSERPILHGENYLSRKKFYAIVMLVVCDDQARVIYHHLGWPGSVHDNRVWRNCKLAKRPEKYFSPKQYLLGDSAFTASLIMVPPFKNPSGSFLSSNQSAFNTLLAKPRVKSEHCIGILKGRFPYLRCIRQKLGNKFQMERIIRFVRGTVVLHNWLIDEPIDDDWIVREGDDDLDPQAPKKGKNEPNYQRRNELLYYLSELEETTIN